MRRSPLLRLARDDGRRTAWRRRYGRKHDGRIEPVSTRDQKKNRQRERKASRYYKTFYFSILLWFPTVKKKHNKQRNKRVYKAVYMYKAVFMFFGKGDEQSGPWCWSCGMQEGGGRTAPCPAPSSLWHTPLSPGKKKQATEKTKSSASRQTHFLRCTSGGRSQKAVPGL